MTKALLIQNIVKENLVSLQSTNTLFNFEPSKSVKLTKRGHDVLCKVGLLQNDGGTCSKYGKYRRLIKNKGDGLVWKCTSCKKTNQSIRHVPSSRPANFHYVN